MSEIQAARSADAESRVRPVGARSDPTWRLLATLLLMAVTLPVFLLGSVAALPVLLLVGAGVGLNRLRQLHEIRRVRFC